MANTNTTKKAKAVPAEKTGKTAANTKSSASSKGTSGAKAKSSLPQNLVLFGNRPDSNKRIYISQPVYRTIGKFATDKTKVETGGFLIGDVIEEMDKVNIIITAFIEAKDSTGTPTTLTFNHETWNYLHETMNSKYKDKKIVGWIHTHPDFGIFLSENDLFIHKSFFAADYNVAYVIDPVRGEEGFYYWVNGKIDRCPGFYLFDSNGKKIKAKPVEERKPTCPIAFKYATYAFASVAFFLAVLLFINSSNVRTLEAENTQLTSENTQLKQIVTEMIMAEEQAEAEKQDDATAVISPEEDASEDETGSSEEAAAEADDANAEDAPEDTVDDKASENT